MHILVCPNAFKNSLNAGSAAKAIERGLQQSNLNCTTQCFPVGDGGDGTGSLLTQLCGGSFSQVTVSDPLGRKINTTFGLIDSGKTAVIEMAAASGLHLLKPVELNPLYASSFGTGELMSKALDAGVTKILLCVGGSATVDGGTGILQALGVRFLDQNANPLETMPESLRQLVSIDLSAMDPRVYQCECIILCDVANTLLGPKGSAAVFGPQKGASAEQVQQLEASLTQLTQVVLKNNSIDISQTVHGGAAGGVAAGLHAFLNARLVNGIDHFLDKTGFDAALLQADLVITGEGSIDLQTLEGKGPYGVAVRAKNKNIPVYALAGKLPLPNHPELRIYFDVLLEIGNGEQDLAAALLATEDNLISTAKNLGDQLAIKYNDRP